MDENAFRHLVVLCFNFRPFLSCPDPAPFKIRIHIYIEQRPNGGINNELWPQQYVEVFLPYLQEHARKFS